MNEVNESRSDEACIYVYRGRVLASALTHVITKFRELELSDIASCPGLIVLRRRGDAGEDVRAVWCGGFIRLGIKREKVIRKRADCYWGLV